MVIQGAAGSGKTSVALHRIAYLLYHDRENLKSSNVLILSPNGVFADYISHILPELGEENIREMSFDLFAYRELKGYCRVTVRTVMIRLNIAVLNPKIPGYCAERKQSRGICFEGWMDLCPQTGRRADEFPGYGIQRLYTDLRKRSLICFTLNFWISRFSPEWKQWQNILLIRWRH